MNNVKSILTLSIIFALFLMIGCTPQEPADEATEDTGETTEVPAEISTEGFEMLSGEDFDLGQYKGSVVVVDVWATWCPPCKKEIPDLIEINNEYKDKGVVMLGISMDDNAMKVVPKFAEEKGMNYPNYDGKSGGLEEKYNSPYLPTKFFYDRDGNEVHSQFGMMSKEDIVENIEKLL